MEGNQIDSLLGEGQGLEFEKCLPDKFRSSNYSVEDFSDKKKFIRWMNQTKTVPLEAMDSYLVAQTYAAAIWEFRAAALSGNLKVTKAIEAWLTWAKPIISQMAQRDKPTNVSKGSVAFLPREPDKAESGDLPGENDEE